MAADDSSDTTRSSDVPRESTSSLPVFEQDNEPEWLLSVDKSLNNKIREEFGYPQVSNFLPFTRSFILFP